MDPDDRYKPLAELVLYIINKKLLSDTCNTNPLFISNAALGTPHLKQAIRPVLACVCQFWGHHLEPTTIPIDVLMIRMFMHHNLLYWFEATHGLEQSYFAFQSLDILERWLTNNFHGPISLHICISST